jgi:signal transduction histidine kinase
MKNVLVAPRSTWLIRLIIGIAVIILITLAYFYFWMHPPVNDLGLMALFLTTTAGISTIAGYIAYRTGWMHQAPAVIWSLLGGYILSSALIFFNVWVTANLMFASPHDLQLATVLLVFATGIAVVLGYFLSSALVERISQLRQTAAAIAGGDLNARTSVKGRDEIASLAKTLNDMAAQLQQAQDKQREVDNLRRDLIAWVSHDLQTPLTSMRALVEALVDGIIEDEPTRERYLKTIQREIQMLSVLIDDLFQMAQIDAAGLNLAKSSNSLSDLVSDTLESLSGLASQRGIHLHGMVAPEANLLDMDPQHIGRVLKNLISNSLRHTPSGGNVQVEAVRQGMSVVVTVKDDGEGIPAQDLPFIFDRFYRGEKSRSRKTGGAGLGLAIAKGIVEAHGGEITVTSKPDEGTKFTFILPFV